MHQLVALVAYLLLAVGTTREPGHPWHEQLAYALGSAVGHVVIFLVLHAIVFFGARAYRPKDIKVSFVGTRLNYLTLGLLVFFIAARMVKHSPL